MMLFKGDVKRMNSPSPPSLVLGVKITGTCLELKPRLACTLHFKSPLSTDHHHHSMGQALRASLHISPILQLGLF